MAVSISAFFSLFLLFWLKKNDLVSVIGLYSVKLQLEKAAHAIVFEATIKWKKSLFLRALPYFFWKVSLENRCVYFGFENI